MTESGLQSVPCILCGGEAVRLSYVKFGLHIVKCVGCHLRFVSPRYPKEIVWQRYSEDYFLNEYLPSFEITNGTVDLDTIAARHAETLTMFETALGGAGRLLDIGSGAGFLLAAAKLRKWDAIGVDLSETAVHFARTTLGVDARQGTAESIAALPETFDVVTMFDVIEHLYDPIEVLRLSKARLRPGGLIMVSTPNYHALSRFMLGSDWAVLSPLEHLYYFTADTLLRAFAVAGFSQGRIHREHTSWCLFDTMHPLHTHAPRSIRSRAYRRLVLRLDRYHPLVQRVGRGDILLGTARS